MYRWQKLCLSVVGMTIASLAVSFPATAVTLTFDDGVLSTPFQSPGVFIPEGYGGFVWNEFISDPSEPGETKGRGMAVMDGSSIANSGYNNSIVSKDNVAYNSEGGLAKIFRVDRGTFNFNSAYFTAAWNDGLQVRAQGLRNGKSIVELIFTVNTDEPLQKIFNFAGIDELWLSSSGGTKNPFLNPQGSGTQFAMDDFVYNEPIPEPIPTPMLLPGAIVWGLQVVRKQRQK